MSSVLWRCWLGGRNGIQPVKNWVVGCWRGICLERGADLHVAKLMPLPLTVSCFCKIQIGFAFLVPAYPGSTGQRAVKRVCVLCVDLLQNTQNKSKLSPGHTRLSFIHKTINCVHQASITRTRQGAKNQPYNTYTVGRHSQCLPWYWATYQLWEFFSASIEKWGTQSVRYFIAVSQQMLTAIKHGANDILTSGRTVHWHVMLARSNTDSQLHFF